MFNGPYACQLCSGHSGCRIAVKSDDHCNRFAIGRVRPSWWASCIIGCTESQHVQIMLQANFMHWLLWYLSCMNFSWLFCNIETVRKTAWIQPTHRCEMLLQCLAGSLSRSSDRKCSFLAWLRLQEMSAETLKLFTTFYDLYHNFTIRIDHLAMYTIHKHCNQDDSTKQLPLKFGSE